MKAQRARFARQGGGFVVGFVVGLLIGLVLALAVALYVTKVPVPFVNKVPQRTAEQDAAEAERNKSWDPNSGLAGKAATRPASGAATASPPAAVAPPPAPAAVVAAPPPSSRDPAAILGEKRPATPPTSAAVAADPFMYFVQAGAYSRPEDAEQQRARLGMLGLEAKLSEREQGGRTMYRVRVGPFDRKDDAEAAKDKLQGGGIDAALVRVQK
jgi:cell division protein FtsN